MVRPLQQLKEENAAAAELGLKWGGRSCKALREAKQIHRLVQHRPFRNQPGDAGQELIPVLPALEQLQLVELSA